MIKIAFFAPENDVSLQLGDGRVDESWMGVENGDQHE